MYWVIQVVSLLLSWVPESRLAALARALAALAPRVARRRYRIMQHNIARAFPAASPRKVQDIARESVYHFVLTVLEFLAVRDGTLGDRTEIASGHEVIRDAVAEGRGVYILCIHMGNWEAMSSGLDRLGYLNLVVTKPVRPAGIGRFVRAQRARNGMHEPVRERKGDAYRAICGALKRNWCIGFICDQARPGSPRIDFFGAPAETNTSLAAIYLKNPAPIVPMRIERLSVHRHRIWVLPRFEPPRECKTGAEQDWILTFSRAVNHTVEAMIQACPQQYFWAHNRWKRAYPAGGGVGFRSSATGPEGEVESQVDRGRPVPVRGSEPT